MRFFLCSLAVLFLFGCADPTYVQEILPQNNLHSKLSFDCSLQFPKSQICLSYQWETPATETTAGRMTLRLFTQESPDNFPLLVDPKKEIKVVLWMPSMGHGSSPVTVENLKTGTYRASNIYFVMPGEWEIKFQIITNPNEIDEVVLPFTL